VRFNFSPAIGGLAFPLLDIDNSAWRDLMLIRATYQGSLVSGSGTVVDGNPTVQSGTPAGVSMYTCTDIQNDFGSGLCFTGDGGNAANNGTRGNVDFSFAGLVEQLEVSYCEADNSSHNSQLTAFGDISWDYVADFGDAPLSYGHASHEVDPLLYLGDNTDTPDGDTITQDSADARGDNDNGVDDENAVTFSAPGGNSISAEVVVSNTTGGSVYVCGWLDIPSAGGVVDGVFDSSDGRCVSTSNPSETFEWSNLPADQLYTSYARFRTSSDFLDTSDATGATMASDGEVEDYRVVFDFWSTAVTIGTVELEAMKVTNFLSGLNVEQMETAVLWELLLDWDPVAASNLSPNNRAAVLSAMHSHLDPDGDGQLAVLYWDTLEERGTIGFYVERKQANSNWIRINDEMLPGLITAPMGSEYQLADPTAESGQRYQYQLIEQEARGTIRKYGPFDVEM